MNYEKKLALAKEALKSGSYDKKTIEYIFPELRQNEDEKIRKEILEYFQQFENEELRGVNISDWIAWLEKQGEQNPTVKPRFKGGDWIVDNCGYTWKIEGILNQFYLLEDVEGGESRPTIEWVDKTCHLWTLKDAKDGDVLATDNSVFIYAKVLYNKPYAYCGVDKFGVFKDNCLNNNWANSVDSVHPATKEQYDTLIKAMTDAGYTFNFNKKELKKIENKPIVIDEGKAEMDYCFTKMMNGEKVSSAWSEEDEEMWIDAIKYLELFDAQGIHGDVAVPCIEWLKSIKDRVHPKQEWSEEDNKALDSILNDLRQGVVPDNEDMDWLKSIKERIKGE